MTCQVKVRHGMLEGKVCKSHFGQTFYSFEGIPYAKPPLGKLRFRAPQELERWSGVRDATKPGNKCVQINPYGNMKIEGSEDCLYLNVYTPKLPAEDLDKLPVLFFVHGGRLLVGYGDYYRPDYLIRHNVILVTINYRLHILGFLSLHTSEIPGNAGIKDSIMALKWVKDNIQYFNGNPDNVTAFGESAGGAIVTSYLTSDMAEGLFHKIISQSGNLLSDLYMIEDDEEAKARHILNIMGKETTDLKSVTELLTEASIHDLLEATVVAELSRPPAVINAYFLPVVEKEFKGVQRFMEENPHRSLKKGKFKKVPILVSMCSHEGGLFLQNEGDGNFAIENNLEMFIPRYLFIKPDSPRAKAFGESLRKHYFNGRQLTQKDKPEYVEFISDAYFGRDTVMFIESISKSVDTYACWFSFNGSLNTGTMKRLGLKGASHGDLVQYIFFRENKAQKYKEKEKEVVDTLCEAWCNFAKTGKPTWSVQKLEWLPYSTEKKHCLNIDNEIKLIPYPNFSRCDLWFSLMNEKSKL